MTSEEKKQVLQGLAHSRDVLQETMRKAREQRVTLQLGNIDKCRDFLQKLGELSFAFGAAIIPLIIVTHAGDKIRSLPYVLIGVALYLLNGLLALWKSKLILERNADDAPHVGLEEEIYTYPVIHAHNKLLFDLENMEYLEEYRSTSLAVVEWAPTATKGEKPRISLWSDLLLINFVVASILIIKAVWAYSTLAYWIIFAVAVLLMVVLTIISYMRAWKNQLQLKSKREKLAAIKAEYQKWHNDHILKPKS